MVRTHIPKLLSPYRNGLLPIRKLRIFFLSVFLFDSLRWRHTNHDYVIKWKHFPRYWPFVRGIHLWIPRTKASDAELRCFLWSAPWIDGWVNNRKAGNLRRQRAHYDVIVINVMTFQIQRLQLFVRQLVQQKLAAQRKYSWCPTRLGDVLCKLLYVYFSNLLL